MYRWTLPLLNVVQVHLSLYGVRSVSSLSFYFLIENHISKQWRPNQMPIYVVSDLDLHCLPLTLLCVSG